MQNPWTSIVSTNFAEFNGRLLLPLLAGNSCCAVRVSGFLEPEHIAAIVRAIDEQGIDWYPGFTNRQGRIGICATEYHSKPDGVAQYFNLVERCDKIKTSIFKCNDPIGRLLSMLSRTHDSAIAREHGLNEKAYFTGLIRAMKTESTLHYDYAPDQLPGWWISNTQEQIGAVIYLQMPNSGGALRIHNLRGSSASDQFNRDRSEKGPRGYDEGVLSAVEFAEVLPESGDLILFNSRNFHQVLAIDSEVPRYSVNSFISIIDGKLYLWN